MQNSSVGDCRTPSFHCYSHGDHAAASAKNLDSSRRGARKDHFQVHCGRRIASGTRKWILIRYESLTGPTERGPFQTNKSFSSICNSRVVWKHFLQNLDVDEAPNVPPHVLLGDLSGLRLKEIVLDAKQRKQAWTTGGEVHLEHIELFRIPSSEWGRINPRLLPGGKHVLLDYRGQLELWSVESKARLWRAPAAQQHHVCVAFDFDLAERGEKLNFAAWFEKDDGLLYVRVFSYDFRQGKGWVVLQRDMDARFIWKLMIRGRLLMVHIPNTCNIFLVDIHDQSTVVIDYSELEVSDTSAWLL